MRAGIFEALAGAVVLRPDLLATPIRRQILDLIASRPGSSIRALARLTSTTWPNVKYHVLRLEGAGLVSTRLVGRRRVCFVADDASPDLVEARGILAEPTARALALHIAAHPGQSLARIVAEVGVSERVAYYHLKRFLDHGLVEHAPDARYRGLVATATLYHALA